jgi:hypothetical protein
METLSPVILFMVLRDRTGRLTISSGGRGREGVSPPAPTTSEESRER